MANKQDDGWQELPQVSVRAMGPLAGGEVIGPCCTPRGVRVDCVSVPIEVRIGTSTARLEIEVSSEAFRKLGPNATLEDLWCYCKSTGAPRIHIR